LVFFPLLFVQPVQDGLRLHAGAALVHQCHLHAKTPAQLVGKAAAVVAGVLFLAVQRQRQPDDDPRRLPLLQQGLYRGKTRGSRGLAQDGQRLRLTGYGVAQRHADFAQAVIKRQQAGIRR